MIRWPEPVESMTPFVKNTWNKKNEGLLFSEEIDGGPGHIFRAFGVVLWPGLIMEDEGIRQGY